jgi:hypothetical protein
VARLPHRQSGLARGYHDSLRQLSCGHPAPLSRGGNEQKMQT